MSSANIYISIQSLTEKVQQFPELLDSIKVFPQKDKLSLLEIIDFFQSRMIKPDRFQAILLLLNEYLKK